jgi:transcriptional regulator GlxA family with amidase domain
MTAVEKNIGNESLGVDDLAKEACLSQRQLSRKLLSLTNLSPVEFIRYVRLERARDLLQKNAGLLLKSHSRLGSEVLPTLAHAFASASGALPLRSARTTSDPPAAFFKTFRLLLPRNV